MSQAEARLAAEVEQMLAEAERIDAAEDAAHGPDNRGDDLQGELARREPRLAKIGKAKADLGETGAGEGGGEGAGERREGRTERGGGRHGCSSGGGVGGPGTEGAAEPHRPGRGRS